jgi:hypothetical protein
MFLRSLDRITPNPCRVFFVSSLYRFVTDKVLHVNVTGDFIMFSLLPVFITQLAVLTPICHQRSNTAFLNPLQATKWRTRRS